jgi:uncharacterized protein YggT (Ycf19 family)
LLVVFSKALGQKLAWADYITIGIGIYMVIRGLGQSSKSVDRLLAWLYQPFRRPIERYGRILSTIFIVAISILAVLMITGHVYLFRTGDLPDADRPINVVYGLLILVPLAVILIADAKERGWLSLSRLRRGR